MALIIIADHDYRDLRLVSSLARVRRFIAGNYSVSQTSVIYEWWGFSCCPYYLGVRYSGVSTR